MYGETVAGIMTETVGVTIALTAPATVGIGAAGNLLGSPKIWDSN